MKFYTGSLTLVNPESEGVYDALGLTEGALLDQFALMAVDLDSGLREGKINNIGDVVDILSKKDFFFGHMVALGIKQFMDNYAQALMSIQGGHSEEDNDE